MVHVSAQIGKVSRPLVVVAGCRPFRILAPRRPLTMACRASAGSRLDFQASTAGDDLPARRHHSCLGRQTEAAGGRGASCCASWTSAAQRLQGLHALVCRTGPLGRTQCVCWELAWRRQSLPKPQLHAYIHIPVSQCQWHCMHAAMPLRCGGPLKPACRLGFH